jgi:esterase/lipase superfamily enzyme
MGLDMPVKIHGHYGTPLLIFPTSGDSTDDYENHSMLGALGHHLEAGRIKLFCPRSINNQSWFDDSLDPAEKARRETLYDRYVIEELVPFIHHQCGGAVPICSVGSSFGTYHAMNELLKHPDVFRWNICMSGLYDIRRYTGDFQNDDVYFNNPPQYAPNLHDAGIRQALDGCSINIISGQGPWEHVDWSQAMSDSLAQAGIRHNLDLWGFDVAHDWPWWKKQLNHYIPMLFG